ncbi:CgeB family protein [Winogradskyella arenosi]|uniref:Glycosyl transferase family 1 n=1 Tax=Winogradskyella arenosi TaxID=533325 RepID=A0A368ZBM0_9FLAO|nr:glycosyltransferase [Winogradskyella arenosi]RCW90253.1 glycosyl transferase family 1 [Winogradskyella arenosi]
MKVLYIGQHTEGTTSKMRAVTIQSILEPDVFEVIDTHIPFFRTTKVWRSLGFRYKIGPLIAKVNTFISEKLKTFSDFDLIWVDKGVFIQPKTLKLLRARTKKLVHFTPDMGFYANQSKLFFKSIDWYDFVITTKSAELEFYEQKVEKEKIILTTQGFDKDIHQPKHSFEDKDDAIVFIGLAEPSRLVIAERIIKENLKLKLVGKGWGAFVEKHKADNNLIFLGEAVYSGAYSELISSSKFALGLLSKHFPELHTTRTFEIPACGTALLTEKNIETSNFYNDKEVVFYKDLDDLISKVKYYKSNNAKLKTLTTNGFDCVHKKGFDYESIIKRLLNKVLR